jgi:hypothetical protein
MGLTNGHAAFASFNESGLNKFIRNFATARPHYLHLATSGLGGGTPTVGLLPPLTIPGAGYGLDYRIEIMVPVIDFFPQSRPLPPGLSLAKNQFSITAGAEICVICMERIREAHQKKIKRDAFLCADLKVWAIGHPTVLDVSSTDKLIGLTADAIVIKDVGGLEQIAECVAKDALNAILLKMRYLVEKHVFGALTFYLGAGPEITDDQIKVWGDIS